jgi:hypothetical protein
VLPVELSGVRRPHHDRARLGRGEGQLDDGERLLDDSDGLGGSKMGGTYSPIPVAGCSTSWLSVYAWVLICGLLHLLRRHTLLSPLRGF